MEVPFAKPYLRGHEGADADSFQPGPGDRLLPPALQCPRTGPFPRSRLDPSAELVGVLRDRAGFGGHSQMGHDPAARMAEDGT